MPGSRAALIPCAARSFFLSLYLFCSGFLRNFFHLFAVMTLWVATVLAFLGEWRQPGQGMAKIGYAIIAVIVVSGLFSFGQEYRIERTANPRGTSQSFCRKRLT